MQLGGKDIFEPGIGTTKQPNNAAQTPKNTENEQTNGIKTLRQGAYDGEIKDGKMGVATCPLQALRSTPKSLKNLTGTIVEYLV